MPNRKRTVFSTVVIISLLILAGCSQLKSNTTHQTDKQAPPSVNATYSFKDDNFYASIAEGIDLCFPELTFTDAKQISDQNLYLLFTYYISSGNLFDKGDQWLDKKNGVFRVPVSVIEPTLKKHLLIDRFDPVKAFGTERHKFDGVPVECGYFPDKGEYVTPVFAGFGGARFPKILDKEYLESNIVKFRVGFYDDSYKQLNYEKLFTIEENQSDFKEYKLIAVTNIAK